METHLVPEAFLPGAGSRSNGSDAAAKPAKRGDKAARDKRLVTRRGARILERYDEEAGFFLKAGLTYRNRRNPDATLRRTGLRAPGLLTYEEVDCLGLRLFALSLLWRAVVTKSAAYSGIVMEAADLERLRILVASGDAGEDDEFPAYFAVFDDGDEIPPIAPGMITLLESPFARFFLDGILCHVSTRRHSPATIRMGQLPVRPGDTLNVVVLSSAKSLHRDDADAHAGEMFERPSEATL